MSSIQRSMSILFTILFMAGAFFSVAPVSAGDGDDTAVITEEDNSWRVEFPDYPNTPANQEVVHYRCNLKNGMFGVKVKPIGVGTFKIAYYTVDEKGIKTPTVNQTATKKVYEAKLPWYPSKTAKAYSVKAVINLVSDGLIMATGTIIVKYDKVMCS